MSASASTLIGGNYLVFGGHLLESDNTHHDLNKVDCYMGFTSSEQSQLYLEIYHAVQDWDWHLGILNQTYGTNYGMTFGETNTYNSEIIFQYASNYITINSVAYSDAYALTEYYDIYNQPNSEAVLTGADWRKVHITFAMQKFTDYANDYGSSAAAALMKRVANHEIGHALGLAHDSRDNGIIMYGNSDHDICEGTSYNFNNMTATVPTLHDLLAVLCLYS